MGIPMSISVHCFYSIPCVKSKMEPSQNCTGSGAVIGPMPAFRRCRKLRPFGFSAALKHFRLRPGLSQRPLFLRHISHLLLLLASTEGSMSVGCHQVPSVGAGLAVLSSGPSC